MLEVLDLAEYQWGDEGLITLASEMPPLSALCLRNSQISDKGLAALLANTKMCKSLQDLYLHSNHITDAGCAALVAALENGQLPALEGLRLCNTWASEEAEQAVEVAFLAQLAKRRDE